MAKLTLVETKKPGVRSDLAHRAAPTEGDAAKELLIANNYMLRRTSKSQYEFDCPFHEEPGQKKKSSGTNFYVDKQTSKYYCQAASCGEKGNLITLERHFGILAGADDLPHTSLEARLQTYQAHLTPDRRAVFYDHGLNDTTIDRFRLGFDPDHEIGTGDRKFKVEGGAYVIPYLEGKHPMCFRYYSPDGKGPHGAKYWYEQGAESRLFNATNAVGDKDGIVFVTEGEQKAMLLCQLGYAAVAAPGATGFKQEWVGQFIHAKQIKVVYDNDNPEYHRYDEHRSDCADDCARKHECKRCGPEGCKGHNPGQEGAMRTMDLLGWKAKNIVLPRPEGVKKVDVNDYFVRDGRSNGEFAELALGRKSSFIISSFAEVMESPPEETAWLIQNLLPTAGRLLVSGAPKVGKSIYIENLALALATGVPFLRRFEVDHPTRVLLLDRELSRRSFYDRIVSFIDDRPGFKAGLSNLLVDHDHVIKIDKEGAAEVLTQLIEMNGAEVLFLDTAYKFFSGDMESSSGVARATDTLDQVIRATNCSVVLTHHHRKGQQRGGKEELPSPDQVVGSFLWTGWPNGTVLLNFAKDRVKDPFSAICSFTAFRDCAPPEPLMLHRDREHVGYTAISPYIPDSEESTSGGTGELSLDLIAAMLIENAPVLENDFVDLMKSYTGRDPRTIKLMIIDLLDQSDDFVRVGRGTPESPYVLRLNTKVEETPWEADHDGEQLAINQLSLVETGASA